MPIPDHREFPVLRTDPPCPPPSGGWPPGTDRDLQGCGNRSVMKDHEVDKTIYHPRPGSVVLVVTTTDVDAVEKELRPVLGARLCIGAQSLGSVAVGGRPTRPSRALAGVGVVLLRPRHGCESAEIDDGRLDAGVARDGKVGSGRAFGNLEPSTGDPSSSPVSATGGVHRYHRSELIAVALSNCCRRVDQSIRRCDGVHSKCVMVSPVYRTR